MKLDLELITKSFNNISHFPEKRGKQDYDYYTELLNDDLKEIGENQGNYKEKFISKVMDIYYAQMRCTSAFIVGPANYNLKRHDKVWASRDNRYNHFIHWRNKYFKAVNRVRTLSPEMELDKAIEHLQFLEDEKSKPYKYKHNLTDKERETHCTVYSVTVKIRQVKKKIETMKIRIERKNNFKPIKIIGGIVDLQNDRLIIKHDEKPDFNTIQAIKNKGFRWSPRFKCWCRKHTGNAVWDINELFRNKILVKTEVNND